MRCKGEEGEILGIAILMPVTLLIFVVGLQGALWWNAKHESLAAAQAGVSAASVSNIAAGIARATAEASQLSLQHVTVAGSAGVLDSVTVQASVPSLVPLLSSSVSVTASAKPETYAAP